MHDNEKCLRQKRHYGAASCRKSALRPDELSAKLTNEISMDSQKDSNQSARLEGSRSNWKRPMTAWSAQPIMPPSLLKPLSGKRCLSQTTKVVDRANKYASITQKMQAAGKRNCQDQNCQKRCSVRCEMCRLLTELTSHSKILMSQYRLVFI